MKRHRSTIARLAAYLSAGLFACLVLPSTAAPPAERAPLPNDLSGTDRLIIRFKSAVLPGTPATHAIRATLARSEADTDTPAAHRQRVAQRLQQLTAHPLTPLRTMADGAHVIHLGQRLPPQEIRRIARQLARDPDILEVLPDRLYIAAATPPPTDPQYTNQWNLSQANGINIQGAWDITTGSSSLVIAVLDTGMLPHNHLEGRWIGGYDFVSLAERSNDGSLRDGDATDPGDWVAAGETAVGQPLAGCVVTDSRWHGTAMAGVIAANANNGGIAGINWNSKILPIRVVGKCGGYESDIADGLRWAVGLAVAGAPTNPHPAKVINVSLAAGGACSSALQNAINDVVATNTPIIVAAGNQSASAGDFSPGNCNNVITVGAVDRNGGKPTYANFGNMVTISALGGRDGTDNTVTNVLTTQNEGTTTANANNDYYRTTFGTSVSTAQVTGIASLILSINPQMLPQNIKEILQNTSQMFAINTTSIHPNPSQADCSVATCGAGIPDSTFAAQAAQRWGNIAPMVAGGTDHGLGLRFDGKLFSWGAYTYGQLGTASIVSSQIPMQANLEA